jgi:predicted dehydrogenase
VLYAFDRWTATFTMRECAAGMKPTYGLEFIGTNGTLGINRSGFTVYPEDDNPPENQVPGIKEGHPVGGPRAVEVAAPRVPRTGAVADRSGKSDEQYRNHARNFLNCIRSRRTPVSDLEGAHRVAIACHLGNLSLRLGRSLAWDAKAEKITGDAEAAKLLVRPYRAPWDKELKALGVSDS